jgi:WD40 repeat protein
VPGPDGTTLLASASADRTVRVWDPATGHPRQFIPVHHEAYALATLDAGTLAIGLSSGLLMLDLRDTNPATTPA